jgi:uncharacterized protein YPO0396
MAKCYTKKVKEDRTLEIVPKCSYVELSQLGDHISQHCLLLSKRLEDLPDGVYKIDVKEGRILQCPLGLW